MTISAVPLHDVDQTLHRLLLVELLVIAAVLARSGLSAFFVVRLGLRPLDRMEVTAGEIAAGQLSRRVSPATSRTEVGRLGLALNAMLERLEQAFEQRRASEERLRRFLADASHELRTPLASIRGYAELFRMGATRDEGETRTAMRRIEEESKRMGALVEDLLTLARLDEAPELILAPVDLAELARDAVEDAHAMAPERSIGLHAPAAAVIYGDSHRLRQVLATCCETRSFTRLRVQPVEVSVTQDAERSRSACAITAPACPTPTPSACSIASGAPREGVSGARPAPASGCRSSAPSSTRTAEGSAQPADGGGARCSTVVRCPGARSARGRRPPTAGDSTATRRLRAGRRRVGRSGLGTSERPDERQETSSRSLSRLSRCLLPRSLPMSRATKLTPHVARDTVPTMKGPSLTASATCECAHRARRAYVRSDRRRLVDGLSPMAIVNMSAFWPPTVGRTCSGSPAARPAAPR